MLVSCLLLAHIDGGRGQGGILEEASYFPCNQRAAQRVFCNS